MKTRDVMDLLLLAALWGASFIFMRRAVPEFGPVVLIALRVSIAAAFLVPLLLMRQGKAGFEALKGKWLRVWVMGVLNTALPFCMLAFALQYVTGGFGSILNATTPLWGAVVAWLWLGDKLNHSRLSGLVIGFAGVLVLVWHKLSWQGGGAALAVPAALLATLSYGVAASFAKRFLPGVNPLSLAMGSQLTATIILLPVALLIWPTHPVSMTAWQGAGVLGIACTAIAYIIFFRLLNNVGPAKAIAVTFLIPVFGVVWGGLFLSEAPTLNMLLGCSIILCGTALSTGLLTLGGKPLAATVATKKA
ncbi:DMT family transporter [Leeia oryzae]|uniref:DMT family transporter n=1 Tax=Leeia oryzae TaxID=356662 RepID=UPI00036F9A32|nr:DMT family transporter [Leeia oryzae]